MTFPLQVETETQIKDGALNVDPDQDAVTIVLGKEKGGYLKGVGYGVTSSRYWPCPRTKAASKEEVALLRLKLQNKLLEAEKKDAKVHALELKVSQQQEKIDEILKLMKSQAFPEKTATAVSDLQKFIVIIDQILNLLLCSAPG